MACRGRAPWVLRGARLQCLTAQPCEHTLAADRGPGVAVTYNPMVGTSPQTATVGCLPGFIPVPSYSFYGTNRHEFTFQCDESSWLLMTAEGDKEAPRCEHSCSTVQR